MQRRATKSGSYMVAAALVLAGAGTISPAMAEQGKDQPADTTMKAAELKSMTATVESVDKAKKTVKLRGPDGEIRQFKLSKDAEIGQLKKGDQVAVDFVQSIALAVSPPGGPKPAVKLTEAQRRMPEGIELGRQLTATAKIINVNTQDHTLTLRGPEGNVETIDVSLPAAQKALENMKAGDQVSVVYTEAVAVRVRPEKTGQNTDGMDRPQPDESNQGAQ